MSIFGVPMAVGTVLGRREGPNSCGLSGRGSVASTLEGNLVGGVVERLVSKAAGDGIVNPCTAVVEARQIFPMPLIVPGWADGVMGERRK